jgi:hypothetical protein
LNGGFEHRDAVDHAFYLQPAKERFYASGSISFPLTDSSVIPAIFGKVVTGGGTRLFGAGADAKIILSPSLQCYGGYSMFESDDLYALSFAKRTWRVAEIKINCSRDALTLTGNAVYYTGGDEHTAVPVLRKQPYLYDTAVVNVAPLRSIGMGLSGTYRWNYLLFEGNAHFVKQNGAGGNGGSVPQLAGRFGIYYTGVHFDSNLAAKAGIYSNFSSAFSPMAYDAFYVRTYYDPAVQEISAHADLNFFAAGEIIKRAIVYFSWENIFDRKYFFTPYYPMPRRGIRFGITWELFN